MQTNCFNNKNNSSYNQISKFKLLIQQQEHKRSYFIIGEATLYDNQVLHELIVYKQIDNLLAILNDN